MAKFEFEFTTDQNTASARGSKIRLRKITVETVDGMTVITGQSQKPNSRTPPFQLELDQAGLEILMRALEV